jgi:hypothetical protein
LTIFLIQANLFGNQAGTQLSKGLENQMFQGTRKTFSTVQKMSSLLLLNLLIFGQILAQTAAPAKSSLSDEEKALAEKITVQTIKDITSTLSADEMEGRGTMQAGGEKAAHWIAYRFKELGLKPLGDAGSYLQKVDFRETVSLPETSFTVGEEKLALGTDYGFYPMNSGNKDVSGDLVFVAYGIQAASIKRDDLNVIDVA